jgi:hypothetical protein
VSVFERMQRIDRRVMYLLLVVVIALPMFVRFRLPTAITPEVRGVYDTVEAIPRGKLAILSGDWGAGTLAESLPQTEAMMRHLFRNGVPFAILPWALQTTTLMQNTAERLAKEYGKVYGRDWVNWGWKAVPMVAFLKSMAKDIPGTVKEDYRGTPLSELPAMKGVKNIDDVGFVCHITPVGNIMLWVAFIQAVYGTPIAYAPTAVMVAQGYDPLDAKQLVGMLPGLVGGAQYETLLNDPRSGVRWSNSLSLAELLMILLIVLANVGYFASRRAGGAGR